MKTSQLVMTVFILSLMEMGASQCDGEKCYQKSCEYYVFLHLSVVRLAAAVRETLSPFMTEIIKGLAIVKNNMSFVKEDVLRIEGKIDSVSIDIEEHKNKTYAAVTEIREDLATVKNNMSFVKEDLLRIGGKIDSVSIDIEEHRNKMDAPTLYECGGIEGLRLVVYLDMIDSNCPSAWKLSHSKRACGRVSTSSPSCDSVFFPASGGDYTNVCGSIRAYQYCGTDAFEE